MEHRRLRIAWSVTCVVVCLLLIAMWMRSITHDECLGVRVSRNYALYCDQLRSRVLIIVSHTPPPLEPSWWYSQPVSEESLETIEENTGPSFLGFGVTRSPGFFRVRLPHWFLVVLAATLAFAPWVSWPRRFSLRAMLVATTLVAVVLGLAAMIWKGS